MDIGVGPVYVIIAACNITAIFVCRSATISPSRASQNRYAPVSPHKMDVDKELLLCLMMVEMSESARGQAYIGQLKDALKIGTKGKEKVREPSQLMESNKQLAHLLQWLYNAGVLEDVRTDILQDPVVQIAFNQVLNKLDIVTTQRDEAYKDLF